MPATTGVKAAQFGVIGIGVSLNSNNPVIGAAAFVATTLQWLSVPDAST